MLKTSKSTIFLIAGRTGGPFLPLPTFAKNLSEFEPIYIGVKNSFEQKYATQNQLKIFYLPEVKLGILSFSKQAPKVFFANLSSLIFSPFLLLFSFFKSIWLVQKFKPKAIVCTGSFLNIPIIMAVLVLKPFFKILKLHTKIIVHQQDPTPGLANSFAIKYADFKSCVFNYTKSKYPNFSTAWVINNPLDLNKFKIPISEIQNNLKSKNPEIYELIFENKQNSSTLPLLFIFGGGGGSLAINNWVWKNLQDLVQKFRIIHLTGILQTEQNLFQKQIKNHNYVTQKFLFDEMSWILKLSDLVICRAGIGSISELTLLKKPAFLIPLANSHQELNAHLVRDFFGILEQKDEAKWLEVIIKNYPRFFENIDWLKTQRNNDLDEYFVKLREIL